MTIIKLLTPITLTIMLSLSCNQRDQDTIKENEIARDIITLASDSMQGRAPLSGGEKKTLKYLEGRMQEIGLEPAFGKSFLQEVPLVEICSSLPKSITINHDHKYIDLHAGKDFSIWSPLLEQTVSLNNSELVFVGYGIHAPEMGWDDFEDVDLNGKTIVVLVNDPGFYCQDSSLFNGSAMTFYGRWTYKFEEANRQGAAGCIIIHEDKAAGYPWSVVNRRTNSSEFYLNNDQLKNQNCKLNGWITEITAKELFSLCGMDYEQMKDEASNKSFKPTNMGAKYSATIKNSWKESSSYNIGGVIRGAKRPNEALVYTAHWDHLGLGTPVNGDSIYNGASDNAAAVAWMLSIAKAFKAEKTPPERSILFLSPTVEESGMLGSQHYVDNPVFEHKNTTACFNSDIIMFLGRYKDVTVTGLGHSELDSLLEQEAKKQGRYICSDPNPENGMFYRSDQLPFLKAGVPSLFAKGFSHQREMGKKKTLEAVETYWKETYHKPSDKFNPEVHRLDGLVEDAILFYELGNKLANSSYFPKWNEKSEFFVNRE